VPPLRLAFVNEDTVRNASTEAGEPDWLRAERMDAVRRVAELPAESNQLFTPYLDLRSVRFADISTYPESGVAPVAAEAPLPEGAAAYVEVRGNEVTGLRLGDSARTAGVTIDTFAHFLEHRPQILRAAIEGGATIAADDAFGQVARAASTLGLVIHVPAGTELDEPLVLRWQAGQSGRGLVSRLLMILDEGARVRLLEEQLADEVDSTESQRLWWGTTEIVLGDRAALEVAGLQDFGADTVAIVNRHATLGQDAQLRWALASVGAVLHKSRIDNVLAGRGSSVSQAEIGFGSGSQLFDLTSYTRHIGEDTTGDLLSKGVFTDRSRGYIKGLIEIRRSAVGTDSFLGEFGMLLARKARSVTIPSLEIDQPNVRRASHSSSVAPIDESQIFYLMSRGLDRDTARRIIVLGFLEPVVARMPLAQARDRLRDLLEAKWPAEAHQAAA
jgi:Fe-S cluster assembly scaffold protein SufB